MDNLLLRVKERIERHGLKRKEAADQIGVTPTSLERHLAGGYVRSDSLAKYRGWLDESPRKTRSTPSLAIPAVAVVEPVTSHALPASPFTRGQPYNVIDLFSGAGGMSLGFDLLREDPGSTPVFQTVLALDVEDKVVALHNNNHLPSALLQGKPACWVNIADFVGAAEMLAFYLDHLASRSGDTILAKQLDDLPQTGLARFKAHIVCLDAQFLATLAQIRSSETFRREYAALDSAVAGQTSVIGFHRAVALPEPTTNSPRLGPLVWAEHSANPGPIRNPRELPTPKLFARARASARLRMSELWDMEISKLQIRTSGAGRGQLASAAGRIGSFVTFLHTPAMREVRDAWLSWRSERDALRQVIFGHNAMESALRDLYTGQRRVDVLLGGPPCQGFSRIGRGKIRSLRENQVHVESDAEAGDVRNLLLLKYVEFVHALEPRVFLFENVRHFQARVQTPEGTFLATEMLKEAIEDLSNRRLRYRIVDGIVDCSRHAIPQRRERFVMAGVRSDLQIPSHDPEQLARACLDLQARPSIPLRIALAGLPAPLLARGQGSGKETGLGRKVAVADSLVNDSESSAMYWKWIRQTFPSSGEEVCQGVDGHTMRPPRPDDEAFFRLLGPGERWMDYRCDDSTTLRDLRGLLETLLGGFDNGGGNRKKAPWAGIDRSSVEDLLGRLDGSLSLRLLLESIDPQEGELHHHLLTASYLAKKEGNNGDWIARLHPDRPAKTIVSHMAKDTYAYVHPSEPRTLSVREAARIQTFPDAFRFGGLGLVDAFRAVGNAVPPLLSHQFARQVGRVLWACDSQRHQAEGFV